MLRLLTKLFPIQPHEWRQALLLFSVVSLWGASMSISRAAAEGLFLSYLGVAYLPVALLTNPFLIFAISLLYSAYTERVAPHRLMILTALLPLPLIGLLRLVLLWEIAWVYFLLYSLVLAYAAVLMLSWSLYLATHYDVQEAKRLVPFISSGLLFGGVLGGFGVVAGVRLLGIANLLLLWAGTLSAGALVVRVLAQRRPRMEAPPTTRRAPKPSLSQTLRDGLRAIRTSPLFTAMALTTLATMAAMQVLEFSYSQIIRAAFPDSTALTALLGLVDGLATGVALALQWFVVPWGLRRLGVQGTNLWYPLVLLLTFASLACAPLLPAALLGVAIFGRVTRMHLLPTLRGTPYSLMLNAAPRKSATLVRSFSTAMVVPLGQGIGALLLLLGKSLAWPWVLPVLGGGLALACLYYTYRQNTAYGSALLDVLRADRIHLVDLEPEDLRHLDADAVAAISARLAHDDAEVQLAAVSLLRTVGSAPASAALRAHLPTATPAVAAAILTALADNPEPGLLALLRPALVSPDAAVRLAAFAGIHRLHAATALQDASALLADPDVQVQAAALALVLAHPEAPAYPQAQALWQTLCDNLTPAAQLAALTVCAQASVPERDAFLTQALAHPDVAVRCAALHVLRPLAETQHLAKLEAAFLPTLQAEELEVRQAALEVLTALGTPEALTQMLRLLEDPQPALREALSKALTRYGVQAVPPLVARLRAPQVSLAAKETALITLARLHGVQSDQLLSFWEAELREVYEVKLMLASLDAQPPCDADTFLRLALEDRQMQILTLLVHMLAVWTSPEVARLVESGLHSSERGQRASALEALESLGERRFTRLLLPLLVSDTDGAAAWRTVAQHQWHLTTPEMPALIATCLQSPTPWLVIGALLAGQARAATLGPSWSETVQHYAATAIDADIRDTAQRLTGQLPLSSPWFLPLPDLLLFLKGVPLYHSLHLEQLRLVATQLRAQRYAAGITVLQQGEHSRDMYLIVSGQVEIVQQRAASSYPLGRLNAGEFFGDLALFSEQPRTATVRTTCDTVLLTMGPAHLQQLLLEEPGIAFALFQALSARIRRFDEHREFALEGQPGVRA